MDVTRARDRRLGRVEWLRNSNERLLAAFSPPSILRLASLALLLSCTLQSSSVESQRHIYPRNLLSLTLQLVLPDTSTLR